MMLAVLPLAFFFQFTGQNFCWALSLAWRLHLVVCFQLVSVRFYY
jgi:hypothetical protein